MSSSTSSVETRHPEWIATEPDWVIVRDSSEGQRQVKSKGQTYLPPTSGMVELGLDQNQPGSKMYLSYAKRAVFPFLVRPAVNALVGVMHREDAVIELPKAMEPIRESATLEGEDLLTLLRRINEQQIMVGRIGLLADVADGNKRNVPYIVTYEAESIINWDESRREDGKNRLDLVVLDESDFERTSSFGWDFVRKYLVLDLVDPKDLAVGEENAVPISLDQNTVYRSRLEISDQQMLESEGVNRQTEVTPSTSISIQGVSPSLKGATLPEIPFVFVGSVDLTPTPDQIPMLGLANLSMTIFRGEADYRNTLFLQGQDTLVTIGDQSDDTKKDRFVGAAASIELPLGGDAKFIGVSSDGLSEQREALENDYSNASELGANLLSSSKGAQKEAEATLQIRVAARTASILTIVNAGAQGLQTILREIAVWMGLDPKQVTVTPNTDFVPDEFTPKDLLDFIAAKNAGAQISFETIHDWLREKGVTDIDFKEELKKIEKEGLLMEPEPEPDPVEDEMKNLMLEELRGRAAVATPNPNDQGNQKQNQPNQLQNA